MARKTTRSYFSFLRGFGNDTPERGFTLAEQLQAVTIHSDQRHLQAPIPSPEWATRFLDVLAGAGRWSIGSITPPYGAVVLYLKANTNVRLGMRNDGDTITAGATAVVPPYSNNQLYPYASALRVGDGAAEPIITAGGVMQLTADDVIGDLWIPPGFSFLMYGTAANTTITATVHVRESVER